MPARALVRLRCCGRLLSELLHWSLFRFRRRHLYTGFVHAPVLVVGSHDGLVEGVWGWLCLVDLLKLFVFLLLSRRRQVDQIGRLSLGVAFDVYLMKCVLVPVMS